MAQALISGPGTSAIRIRNETERNQQGIIDLARCLQIVVLLVAQNGGSGIRANLSVHTLWIISERSELPLYRAYDI